MFDERDPSVQSLQKSGKELIKSTPEADKRAEIQEDLDKVTKQWTLLNNFVKLRREKLDEALGVSEKFATECEDAIKKIDELEKKIESEEWIPLEEPNKIEEQKDNFQVQF